MRSLTPLGILTALATLLASCTAPNPCFTSSIWLEYKGNLATAAAGWRALVFCNLYKLQTSCKMLNEKGAEVVMLDIDQSRVCPLAPKYTAKCDTGPNYEKPLIPSVVLTPTAPCKAADAWQSYDKFIAAGSGATAEIFCDGSSQQTKCRFSNGSQEKITVGTGSQDICAVAFKCHCYKDGLRAIPWVEPVAR